LRTRLSSSTAGGSIINSRDAVGHGTVTAGIAAGNGRSLIGGDHHGVAPEADLIIVKMTSEGALAHDHQSREDAFNGCISQALDWLDQKIEQTGKPAVGLINSGVQLWGPTDGTSIVSRKIDEIFGHRPGRIFVAPAGDEGNLPTHAGGSYSNHTTTVTLARARSSEDSTQIAMWFKGPPVSIAIEFDDDDRQLTARTDVPGDYDGDNGIRATVYNPGQEFYPATSTVYDHFVKVELTGHTTIGRIILRGLTTGVGQFDVYSDPNSITSFVDHLVPGRVTDYASTKSAITVGAYVSTNTWVDVDGQKREIPDEIPGQLWKGSAGGPTRDGRPSIDVAAPGENIFGTYASNSYWATQKYALLQDGQGHFGRQGATSGAAPIVVGAIALMLQMKPDITSDQARELLDSTAMSDENTARTPNVRWATEK
jgi:subtilisin family serine protease